VIAEIDRALDNCRKVPDHSRRIGLPVAFIRMFNEPAFFKRATPLDGPKVLNPVATKCCSSTAPAAVTPLPSRRWKPVFRKDHAQTKG
jgi:hypothetical protein